MCFEYMYIHLTNQMRNGVQEFWPWYCYPLCTAIICMIEQLTLCMCVLYILKSTIQGNGRKPIWRIWFQWILPLEIELAISVIIEVFTVNCIDWHFNEKWNSDWNLWISIIKHHVYCLYCMLRFNSSVYQMHANFANPQRDGKKLSFYRLYFSLMFCGE